MASVQDRIRYRFHGALGEWADEAACRAGARDMFPVSDEDQEAAASFCHAACPVIAECLDHALTHREIDGVWGGTTEKGRRRMIRRRMAQDHAQRAGQNPLF